MMAIERWFVVATLLMIDTSNGAKILGIFPFHARSHAFVVSALMLELANRGHEVTVISYNPQKEKVANYTEIIVKTTLMDLMKVEGAPINFFQQQSTSIFLKAFLIWRSSQETCDLMLQEEEINKLIHATNLHFDLLIIEAFFNECFLGFVHKFKAPLIHLCTFGGTHWIGDWVGNPNPYSYVPDTFLEYSDRMNFWERAVNTMVGTGWRLGRHYYYLPGQDSIMRKHFNDSAMPSVNEIEYSTSLVLLNHHFSISYPRPLMPNMVQVGGMHVKPPNKIPQELEKFLDDATDGVIYFSMGSNLLSSELPDNKRDAFLKAFSQLKQKVLWKWEKETLPGQPNNVRLGKWFPQADILGSREMYDIDNMWHFEKVNFFWNMGIAVCDILFQDEALQNILYANNEKFDILITGAFIHDCVLGIAYKLNISVVKVCPFVGTKWMDEWAGNPTPYAYVPDIFQDMGERMTIWQRIRNTLGEIYIKLGRMFYAIPQQDAILRKYLKTSNIPSLWEMQKSIVLTLINHHFSIGYSRPLMPNIVEIGGIHIRPPRKLNADLQKFIDESPHGVIYFSMGSNLRSSDFKSETLTAFLEAFSKLKERVLWKWETESLPGQPSNVKLGKWMPQSDVLAHPNVKLFVSQGGLLSTQESIHRGVPIIGIPIYGDQRYNLAKIVTSGIGVQLDLANITTESVTWAMNEVLNNSRYRENVQRMSRTFRDQPLTPLDQAVFWTEYVIRHKGAPHMRSAALDLTWYQYFLLDVIAVLTLVTVSVLIIVFLILRAAFKIVFDTFPGKSMHFSKKNS